MTVSRFHGTDSKGVQREESLFGMNACNFIADFFVFRDHGRSLQTGQVERFARRDARNDCIGITFGKGRNRDMVMRAVDQVRVDFIGRDDDPVFFAQ